MYIRVNIHNLSHDLMEASHDFMMTLLIHMDEDINILKWQVFSENKIPTLLLDQPRNFFNGLFGSWVIFRNKFGSPDM